jgi:lipoate---protein ligase
VVDDGGWRIVERTGPAAGLHDRALDASGRLLEVLVPARPSLVLGSAQPESDADLVAAASSGTDVARRRSGGGAVLLLPGRDLWIDITIPPSDPLWDDDVAAATHWLGRVWAAALESLGSPAEVHLGPAVRTEWSKKVCFAGLGPGEVLIGGRKVVGISQRRTREGARFQCLVPRAWNPLPLLGLLDLGHGERTQALTELTDVATGVDRSPAVMLAAFVPCLPL